MGIKMAWVKLRPANSGGARKQLKPSAKVDDGGRLIMNHATVEMLGSPGKILIEWETEKHELMIRPSTPGDAGAYSLSGGGNAQHTTMLRAHAKRWPAMKGEYNVAKFTSGIILRKKTKEELEQEASE